MGLAGLQVLLIYIVYSLRNLPDPDCVALIACASSPIRRCFTETWLKPPPQSLEKTGIREEFDSVKTNGPGVSRHVIIRSQPFGLGTNADFCD